MFFSMTRGRLPHKIVQANTNNQQALARLAGYLGALR